MPNFSDLVRDFHTKYGFPVGQLLKDQNTLQMGDGGAMSLQTSNMLQKFGAYMIENAKAWLDKAALMQQAGDGRLYRAHLMVEEFGEMLVALGKSDEVKLAHETCDLLYTSFGTGVHFSIPLEPIFCCLHISNMSKEKIGGRMRTRDQRPGGPYIPLNVATIIEEARRPKILTTAEMPKPWAHTREKDTLK